MYFLCLHKWIQCLHNYITDVLFWQVIRLGMFEVHCDELIRKLAQRAEEISTRLLQRMTENHTKANKEYACSTLKCIIYTQRDFYNSTPFELNMLYYAYFCIGRYV